MIEKIHYLDYQIDTHYHDTAFYYSIKQGDWGITVLRCYLTNRLTIPLDFKGWTPKLAVKSANHLIVETLPAIHVDYDSSIVEFTLSQRVTQYSGDITCQIFFEKGTEGQEGYGRYTMIPKWKIKVERLKMSSTLEQYGF